MSAAAAASSIAAGAAFTISGTFSSMDSWDARGVTLGSAQTRQGAALHLLKGLVP